jgi:hypothetical protein
VLSLETGETLTVHNFFHGDARYRPVQEARFEDGTEWSYAELAQLTFGGTEGADRMDGTGSADSDDRSCRQRRPCAATMATTFWTGARATICCMAATTRTCCRGVRATTGSRAITAMTFSPAAPATTF